MFNFRNDRGSRRGNQDQGRQAGRRDESQGSGSEDWGQEWGEDWRGDERAEQREGRGDWRGEWRGEGRGRSGTGPYGGERGNARGNAQRGDERRGGESARHGGPWYQQDTPAGQGRGSWGQPGYGASDAGGTGHPYSSGYGGYRPSVQDSGYRSQERDSGYGYRDEDRFGPRGRGGERDDRGSGGERGGRALHWREGMERDRSQRGGEPSYGSGYYGDSASGGQSFSGGQRVYPDDHGYRRSRAFGQQAAAQGWSQHSQHAGRRMTGPKGYHRSDERVREDVCERLAMNPYIDVGEVSVEVANGVVTLDGTVRERREKYVIEEIADAVFGVTEVDNRLRVERGQGGQGDRGSAWAAGSEVGGEDTGTSPERTLNKS
ncbi:BON domain-containing protein [Cupriavidus oxalaticus]|uniref:BON domain-containing protein n=1 Tax=Cupriavidus oxalaticus TaxID=96344 RepID=A0A5P3VER3_9BURK|nr:BON domain-containing protein [Cupriavidus oxalaticus]QEZ43863.1 BON domain-containing protein [Cupriavidus oxalaticus]